MKIVAEDKAVESRTNDFFLDWEKAKPVDGHLRPHDALQKLAIFEGKYVRLKDERDNVSKAKEVCILWILISRKNCFCLVFLNLQLCTYFDFTNF